MPFVLCAAFLAFGPPVVIVDRDNVEITESCIVEIRADVIRDEDGNGVIHVGADGITIEFADGHHDLFGAETGTSWDTLEGIGIRIDGHRDVTIRHAHLHRFKVGIYATDADGLVLEGCDVAGGFAQRLRSSPAAEDSADWIWPHHNDRNEWMDRYGAGIYIEDSNRVTVRGCFARERQNGIVLHRVNDSKVFDNDCSFLSGWGLALWRSSRNFITRNAFDFCVRGYSHRVYNRGQDSAGILMFEQCSDNVIAENSATHGGDGLFAFAGREALGEDWLERERARLKAETGEENVDHLIVYPKELLQRVYRRGNNRNLIINNDFSHAAAHGIEVTFSFDNQIIGNRIVGNAICGLWGGYSQDTLIAGNEFQDNGGMGYGLERGGINIEHGVGNLILENGFRANRCGIHLWWDADEKLMTAPWAKVNHPRLPRDPDGGIPAGARPADGRHMLPSADNIIEGNTFIGDDIAIQLRSAESTFIGDNHFENVGAETDSTDSQIHSGLGHVPWRIPRHPVLGETRPVGARGELAGRKNIIMTEWWPYDWSYPYLHRVADQNGRHVYRLLGATRVDWVAVAGRVEYSEVLLDGEYRVEITPVAAGAIVPYAVTAEVDGEIITRHGVIGSAEWSVRVFAYETDPRVDLNAWRQEAEANGVTFIVPHLDLVFGMGGPSDLADIPDAIADAALPVDHFGTIARTKIAIPAGRWRIRTRSDDGIRVRVDDRVLIEDWTHHVPRTHTAEITLNEDAIVEIVIEHFELKGNAVLSLEFEPLSD